MDKTTFIEILLGLGYEDIGWPDELEREHHCGSTTWPDIIIDNVHFEEKPYLFTRYDFRGSAFDAALIERSFNSYDSLLEYINKLGEPADVINIEEMKSIQH